MNACPACSQPVGPNDLVCPKCGISLHPGTATAGPAAGEGKGLSVVAIVVIAIVGIVLLLGCLGLVGSAFWFIAPGPGMAPATPAPLPPIDTGIIEELPTVETSAESQTPDDEALPGRAHPEESTTTP
jgi:hypothetical protein